MPKALFAENILDEGPGVKWKRLPVTQLLPSLTPDNLKQYGSVWRVDGEPQGMLRAAVSDGNFITLNILRKIKGVYNFSLPESGSTPSGRIGKLDYATSLVKAMFPASSHEDQNRMINGIMGKNSNTASYCPEEVLACLSKLDADTQADNAGLQDVLNKQFFEQKVQKEVEARLSTRATVTAKARRFITPPLLKPLLPLGGAGVYCDRNVDLKRYQAFYPRAALS